MHQAGISYLPIETPGNEFPIFKGPMNDANKTRRQTVQLLVRSTSPWSLLPTTQP